MSNTAAVDNIGNFLEEFRTRSIRNRANAGGSTGYSPRHGAATFTAGAGPYGPLQTMDAFASNPFQTNRSRHHRGGSYSSSSNATRSTARSDVFDGNSSQGSEQTTRASTVPSTRRRLPSEFAHVIAHRTVSNGDFILPCEFAGYSGCDRKFELDETDAWIEHIIRAHLLEQLPSKSVCWFCDSFTFHAQDRGFDLRTNFEYRMNHIRDHIKDDGYTLENVRPDYFFLDHLRQYNLVSEETDQAAREWCERSHFMDGIYRHDFETPERQKENNRLTVVVHDLAKEERMRKRQSGRSRRN